METTTMGYIIGIIGYILGLGGYPLTNMDPDLRFNTMDQLG